MDPIEYQERGLIITQRAKTDNLACQQLLVYAYAIVKEMVRQYRDRSIARMMEGIIQVWETKDAPGLSRELIVKAEKIAQDLAKNNRERIGKDTAQEFASDEALGFDEKMAALYKKRRDNFRTLHTLDCLVALLDMDRNFVFARYGESALVFWHKIYTVAPAVFMEFGEESAEYSDDKVMDKYRDIVWSIISSAPAVER